MCELTRTETKCCDKPAAQAAANICCIQQRLLFVSLFSISTHTTNTYLTVGAEVKAVSAAAAETRTHDDGVVLRGWHVDNLRPVFVLGVGLWYAEL